MEDSSEDILRFQILRFLVDFKNLISQGNYYITNHLKNLQALAALGITLRQRDEAIFAIQLEDYVSGPLLDKYHPGNIWVFGKNIESIEIYIKLKIITYNNGNEKAVCLSFHPAEKSMDYPFRSR